MGDLDFGEGDAEAVGRYRGFDGEIDGAGGFIEGGRRDGWKYENVGRWAKGNCMGRRKEEDGQLYEWVPFGGGGFTA